MQQPTIIDKPDMTFVGLEASFIHIRSPDANSHEVIGPLWEQFLPRRDEIKQAVGDAAYGVIYGRDEADRNHKHELQYIACLQVTKAEDIPAGMTRYTVPAAKFACFLHKGEIFTIGKTIDGIYDGFLKNEPFEHAGIADIELYDERFCMKGSSEMEYWISVKPKATEGSE